MQGVAVQRRKLASRPPATLLAAKAGQSPQKLAQRHCFCSLAMPSTTRRQKNMDEKLKVALHPYKRLCKEAHTILQQQAACETMEEMALLCQHARPLFSLVALMHVCPRRRGASMCTMCEEATAYGPHRPWDENPDPFRLLSTPSCELIACSND